MFVQYQRRLAAHYGSDRSMADLSRVMRVPGFYHNKRGRHLVTLIKSERVVYPVAEIMDGVPPMLPVSRPPVARVPYATRDLVELFKASRLYVRADGDKHVVRCPWEHEHSTPWRGASDTATVLFDGGGFDCKHSHCAERGRPDVLRYFGADRVERFRTTSPEVAAALARARRLRPQLPRGGRQ